GIDDQLPRITKTEDGTGACPDDDHDDRDQKGDWSPRRPRRPFGKAGKPGLGFGWSHHGAPVPGGGKPLLIFLCASGDGGQILALLRTVKSPDPSRRDPREPAPGACVVVPEALPAVMYESPRRLQGNAQRGSPPGA